MAGWSEADIPDQAGRIAVVTGASSGIGLEAARALAQAGAELVLAVRDPGRGMAAAAAIRQSAPAARLRVMQLDLASLASVRAFAAAAEQELPRIDLLLNNAGLGLLPHRQVTADGFEMQIGTNHLGHFALTALLVPVLLRAPAARVVTIASIAHRRGRIDFDDLQLTRRYSGRASYNRSKLANLIFALELARRAQAVQSPIASLAAHPGLSLTGFIPASGMPGIFVRAGLLVSRLVGQSARAGALPGLYAGTMPDAKNGEYWGPDGIGEVRGHPRRAGLWPQARRQEDWARLWQMSEALTGVTFPSLARAGG